MPSDDTTRYDEMIDAGAAMLDLQVDPEWRAAIRTHLEISLRHARNLDGFVLSDEAEAAPVYRA